MPPRSNKSTWTSIFGPLASTTLYVCLDSSQIPAIQHLNTTSHVGLHHVLSGGLEMAPFSMPVLCSVHQCDGWTTRLGRQALTLLCLAVANSAKHLWPNYPIHMGIQSTTPSYMAAVPLPRVSIFLYYKVHITTLRVLVMMMLESVFYSYHCLPACIFHAAQQQSHNWGQNRHATWGAVLHRGWVV